MEDLSYQTLRPLYPVNAPAQPYRGLRKFVTERAARGYAMGEGGPPEGAGLPALRSSEEVDEDEGA